MRSPRGDQPLHELLHDLVAERVEAINHQRLSRRSNSVASICRVNIMGDHRRPERSGGAGIVHILQGDAVQRLGEFHAFHAAKRPGSGPHDDPAFAGAEIDEHKVARVDPEKPILPSVQQVAVQAQCKTWTILCGGRGQPWQRRLRCGNSSRSCRFGVWAGGPWLACDRCLGQEHHRQADGGAGRQCLRQEVTERRWSHRMHKELREQASLRFRLQQQDRRMRRAVRHLSLAQISLRQALSGPCSEEGRQTRAVERRAPQAGKKKGRSRSGPLTWELRSRLTSCPCRPCRRPACAHGRRRPSWATRPRQPRW
jgi:hypothetical protein